MVDEFTQVGTVRPLAARGKVLMQGTQHTLRRHQKRTGVRGRNDSRVVSGRIFCCLNHKGTVSQVSQ